METGRTMNAAPSPEARRTARSRSGRTWPRLSRRSWPETRLHTVVGVSGLVLAIALSLRFGLAGSATSVQSGAMTSPGCAVSSQPSPMDVPAGELYQTTSHVFTVRDAAKLDTNADVLLGARWKVTLSVGPWLPGSDQVALENAWRQTSGKTSGMPLAGGKYKQLGDRGVPVEKCLDSRQAAYLFGTVEFEDLTAYGDAVTERVGNSPPYPTSDEIGDLFLLANPDTLDPETIFACFGHRCGHNVSGSDPANWINLGIPFVLDNFAADTAGVDALGPHPFIVAIPEVFQPGTSVADARVSDYVLQLDCTCSIEPRIDPRVTKSTHIPTQTSWEHL